MITRPAAQSSDFAHALEAYGARVIHFSVIEIVPPDSFAALDAALAELELYDWIIFTSINAVDYFMRRFELANGNLSDLDELRVCAIGDATANRLGDLQIHVDVVPNDDFNHEGIIAALENYLGGTEALRDLHFLLPRAAHAREHLPRALRQAGAKINVVTAYQTITAHPENRGRVEAMLRGGGIDCLTFTSGSSIINFRLIFDSYDLKDLLGDTRIACIGHVTARVAAEHQLPVHIIPPLATTHALAASIAAYFEDEERGDRI